MIFFPSIARGLRGWQSSSDLQSPGHPGRIPGGNGHRSMGTPRRLQLPSPTLSILRL